MFVGSLVRRPYHVMILLGRRRHLQQQNIGLLLFTAKSPYKKLSYRRETARQLLHEGGKALQPTPPPLPLATSMRSVVNNTFQKYSQYQCIHFMKTVAEKPHDAVVKFDTYRALQRHRTVLSAIARLSCLLVAAGQHLYSIQLAPLMGLLCGRQAMLCDDLCNASQACLTL